MKGDPVLATKDYTERNLAHRIIVFGGVHYIRGNRMPYFSLTCDYGTLHEHRTGNASGGCAHDVIRKHFGDRFDDLAALHRSDIDGVPMYALENGFFRFYDDGGYRGTRPTWEKRREQIAEHFRISPETVDNVLLPMMGEGYSASAGVFMQGKEGAKARLAAWIEEQKPRWKAEADACIAKHGLKIYGDKWP